MNVNFKGFGENVITFLADSSLTKCGVPVKIKSDSTVGACSNGDKFCGVCVGLNDGYASVQLNGCVEVFTTSKVAVGFKNLTADGNGNVVVGSSGKEYLVLSSETNRATILL